MTSSSALLLESGVEPNYCYDASYKHTASSSKGIQKIARNVFFLRICLHFQVLLGHLARTLSVYARRSLESAAKALLVAGEVPENSNGAAHPQIKCLRCDVHHP